MTYDDASWHTEGEYPESLDPDAAATHIGLFLAWAVLAGHASAELAQDFADEVAALRERTTTGPRLLLAMDGALTADDLDETGNAFAAAYYTGDTGEDDTDAGLYLEDYVDALCPDTTGDDDPADVYRVPDTWESYDQLSPVLDARFTQWEDEGRPAVLRQRG